MTTALPAQVTYGTVVGKLIQAIADSTDSDLNPDSVAAAGVVTFTPAPSMVISSSSSPPVTIVPQPISVALDSNGSFSVVLIATDDTNLNPTNWTYTVSFNLIGVKIGSFAIAVPGSTTTDISSVIPVSSSAGTAIIRGPAGPAGPTGPTGPSGTVHSVVAGANVTVDNTDPANPIVASTGGGGGGGGAVSSVFTRTGAVTAQTGDYTAAQVGADASGAAATAQTAAEAFSVQRSNHTGTQTASTISDFSTAADARITAQKAATNGLATLDSTGKLTAGQLPAIAVNTVRAAASQAAMLALAANPGDIALRSDTTPAEAFMLTASPASTLANWTEISITSAPVTTVFGRSGSVVATTGDYTASQVGADASGAASSAQAFSIQRVNHTGSQTASTISDFANAVLARAEAIGLTSSVVEVSGTYGNRPATTCPVIWIGADAPSTGGTTAGGTAAAVNGLDLWFKTA